LALGFGHVEVGTITYEPQPGNPRPRIWRVSEKQALINAMGFPSEGVAVVAKRLRALPKVGIVGLNLGKNKTTNNLMAGVDYASLAAKLAGIGDYLTINVSSPNTPGLRDLQAGGNLGEIISQVVEEEKKVAAKEGYSRPVWVKLAPDLEDAELEGIADAAVAAGAAGIIATNTTIARDGLSEAKRNLPGGLSGRPLKERADQVVRLLYRTVGQKVPIIGVGGIENAADLLRRISLGASLVQIYTGFVYGGPNLPRTILRDLSIDADRRGWRSIDELVGQASSLA
jgi:dihydroorotate dehydrogenase